jgi:hypothetical protein
MVFCHGHVVCHQGIFTGSLTLKLSSIHMKNQKVLAVSDDIQHKKLAIIKKKARLKWQGSLIGSS